MQRRGRVPGFPTVRLQLDVAMPQPFKQKDELFLPFTKSPKS